MMIYSLLKNTATGRFHPILFRPAPMPGYADEKMSAQRYRSLGHHTDGFDTEEKANEHIGSSCREHAYKSSGICFEWDGASIPAMVGWFSEEKPAAGSALEGVVPGQS
jgi:hypothetical protein